MHQKANKICIDSISSQNESSLDSIFPGVSFGLPTTGKEKKREIKPTVQTKLKRESWKVTDWEELKKMSEEEDFDDEDSSVHHEDHHTTANYYQKIGMKVSGQVGSMARRGSLHEIILQEDAPIEISPFLWSSSSIPVSSSDDAKFCR